MTENKEHDKLFADLNALTEQQIEVGLAGPSCCVVQCPVLSASGASLSAHELWISWISRCLASLERPFQYACSERSSVWTCGSQRRNEFSLC